jgi:hypothetical protein
MTLPFHCISMVRALPGSTLIGAFYLTLQRHGIKPAASKPVATYTWALVLHIHGNMESVYI